MPDPTQDLADIVEPVIPLTATASHDWLLPAGAVVFGLALLIGLYWHWRREAAKRALRRLHDRTDIQQAASELAALRPRFKHAPDAAWLDALQRLRFAPPQSDAQAVFERLCREAAALLQGHR
jgi:hypothetical protein